MAEMLDGEKDRPIQARELFRLSLLTGADNMEGVAYRRSGDGSDTLILVSDDNFHSLQRTQILSVNLSGCDLPPAETGAGGHDEAKAGIDQREG
jgi:hypothetical protein